MWRKALRAPYLDLIVAAIGAAAGYVFIYDPEKARIATILVPALLSWLVLLGIRHLDLVLLDILGDLLDRFVGWIRRR